MKVSKLNKEQFLEMMIDSGNEHLANMLIDSTEEMFQDVEANVNSLDAVSVQVTFSREEFEEFYELSCKFIEHYNKAIDMMNTCEGDVDILLTASVYFATASGLARDLDVMYTTLLDRMEEGKDVEKANFILLDFLTKVGANEYKNNYYEAIEVLDSDCLYFVSWLDDNGVLRHKPFDKELDALEYVTKEPGLGRDNIHSKADIY